jgi:hypothetical protein
VLLPWAPLNEQPADLVTVDARSVARRFDLVVVSPGSSAHQVAAMKRANSSITILVYLNAVFAQNGDAAEYPPSWFARDRDGRRIRSVAFDNWLMDVARPEWRAGRASRCAAMLAEAPYDGCMLDVMGIAPLRRGYASGVPVDARTGRPWRRDAWLAATARIARTVVRRVQPAIVVGNGLGDGVRFFDRAAPTAALLQSLDGAIAESWLRSPDEDLDSYPPMAEWTKDLRMLQALERSGTEGMVLTKAWAPGTRQEKDALHQFALATFLLGTRGQTRFSFSYGPGWDRSFSHPWWRLDLGRPLGPFETEGGVYRRRFERALVLVNPTTRPRRIDVDGPFVDLDGNSVTGAFTVHPHTGVILLSAP